ncbi:MAG: formylglycine-generating enzyme family protein [Arenimonas sp.]
MRFALAIVLACLPLAATLAAGGSAYVAVPGGQFRTALRYEDLDGPQKIAPFVVMRRPVTNGEFAEFIAAEPRWRRDRVPAVFADGRYLAHWPAPDAPAPGPQSAQPVTGVSWFAAQAYCNAQGARLPTWAEWEYVAAADELRTDARADPAWRERILGWYSRPSTHALPRAGLQAPNVYGVQDLHGLVWEWTEDYSALLIDADNRNQGDPDLSRFCGAGALSMNDLDNYAVLMRVAMLSSVQAESTTINLGFRCARDRP